MKNAKITKWSHTYEGCASTYNVEILNSLNPELQLKDIESAIKNKLIDLLSELRGFKFVTTLVLESKKIESNDESKYSTFYSNSKQKELLMKVILMRYLDQFILQLCQTCKNHLAEICTELLIQS